MIEEVKIDSEFITLGQFLKYVDLVSSGGEVREFLIENKITVNSEAENKRGKKLYRNDLVCINEKQYKIC
ncbi:MAG: S4 domain-containing protein YaaA [Erysipelotrichaceae bacterium]|nr:S4 domain-containing protein YaaA [Erysipelotrichaceae bacterium]